MKYDDQLKDQRWIDRREEILLRDNDTCQRCGHKRICAASTNLNVHHKYYIPNTMAWDYPDEALITWCKKCHREEEILKILQELNSLFIQRMEVYKGNLLVASQQFKNEYNRLSNDIAKLRGKLRKIEHGSK